MPTDSVSLHLTGEEAITLIENILGKFDKYRIDLKGMQADTAHYEFLLDNLFFTNIDGPEVQKGKINVILDVKKTSGSYELSFQTDGIVKVPCDRCLDDMEIPVTSSDKLFVKFGKSLSEEGNNVIVIPEDEGDINVAWFIYEFVALSVPMKHVHGPGKCNKSMIGKLNKHMKGSADEESDDDGFDNSMEGMDEIEEPKETDPRWDDLKKILDNNNN